MNSATCRRIAERGLADLGAVLVADRDLGGGDRRAER
jgi:hypothetical protein